MDDILREVRENREAYARKFNYDLDAIHRDLMELQEQLRREGRVFVDPPPKEPTASTRLGPSEDALTETPPALVPQNHSTTS
jgi:hypothetical protein